MIGLLDVATVTAWIGGALVVLGLAVRYFVGGRRSTPDAPAMPVMDLVAEARVERHAAVVEDVTDTLQGDSPEEEIANMLNRRSDR